MARVARCPLVKVGQMRQVILKQVERNSTSQQYQYESNETRQQNQILRLCKDKQSQKKRFCRDDLEA
jgi:hypothetical protein